MAYPIHHLFSFRGTLGSASTGGDIWQVGVRCENTGTGGGSAPSQAACDKARDGMVALFGNPTMAFSSGVSFDEVLGYTIGVDGKAVGAPTRSAPVAVTKGPSGTNLHPWSVSTCVTFDAGGSRNGRFGRIFLPPQACTVANTGRITSGLAQSWADAVEDQLLTVGFGVSGSENYVPRVVSERFGTMRAIALVKVGDIPDTQRRRDNRLRETYYSKPFAP